MNHFHPDDVHKYIRANIQIVEEIDKDNVNAIDPWLEITKDVDVLISRTDKDMWQLSLLSYACRVKAIKCIRELLRLGATICNTPVDKNAQICFTHYSATKHVN